MKLVNKSLYWERERNSIQVPCFLISWSKVWGEVSTVCVIINQSHAVTEECQRKFWRRINGLYSGKAKVFWIEVESEEGQRGDSWHHWCALIEQNYECTEWQVLRCVISILSQTRKQVFSHYRGEGGFEGQRHVLTSNILPRKILKNWVVWDCISYVLKWKSSFN